MSPAAGRELLAPLLSSENPQRRRFRLAPEVDAEVGVICPITIAVKSRTTVFANPAGAAAAVDVFWHTFFAAMSGSSGRRQGTSPRPTAKMRLKEMLK